MWKIKYLFVMFWEVMLFFILFPFVKLFFHKKCVLFSERGVDARDNGYLVFAYFRKNINSYESYYVIKTDSPDYKKISDLGNVIKYKSFKHWIYFIGSSALVSTHLYGFLPAKHLEPFFKRFGILKNTVFLQHGIMKQHDYESHKEVSHLSLYICGAYPEYKSISTEYNYNNGEVVYTGLPRFDNYIRKKQDNFILAMPTWRMYLSKCLDNDFVNSTFYKEWNALLNNQQLIHELEMNNIKLLFYPHHEVQDKNHLFSSSSANVIICNEKDFDIQQLLLNCSLLITDYSSVFFDVAYMRKPQVYFQFDRDEFFDKHYKEDSYFIYKRDSFGPISTNIDETTKYVIKYIYSNFKMESIYLDKLDKFFIYNDTNNTQRVCKAILNMLEVNKNDKKTWN